MNKKILFVHGYTASSQTDWYPAIKPELDKLGVDYSIPDLPGGKNPHSAEWVEIIKKGVDLSSKPVVLVGHSLGTRAVLLYLDKYQKKADAVILIAVASMAVGVISRLLVQPVYGIFARAFLQFAGICLLLAIALLLREK